MANPGRGSTGGLPHVSFRGARRGRESAQRFSLVSLRPPRGERADAVQQGIGTQRRIRTGAQKRAGPPDGSAAGEEAGFFHRAGVRNLRILLSV